MRLDSRQHVRVMLASFVAAAAMCLAVPVWAQSDKASDPVGDQPEASDSEERPESPSIREKLVQLLSGYHYTPDRDDLEPLGSADAVATALRGLARDGDLRPSMRLRAVDTLAFYEDSKTIDFLKECLGAPEEDLSEEQEHTAELLRHHAMTSLARNRSDERAVELLERFLTDDDLQLRLTAIAALGRYAGDPGRRRLQTLAKDADDEIVRSEIAKYVDLESPPSGDETESNR